MEWIRRLSLELMKVSPSHALRACMTLVDIHPPLARELFNAAFLSCWIELYEQYQVRSRITRDSSSVLTVSWVVGGTGTINRASVNEPECPI